MGECIKVLHNIAISWTVSYIQDLGQVILFLNFIKFAFFFNQVAA